ncbi:MAG: four helix bundle protein [Candidatus Brocadiia bacterium]
MWIGSRKYDNTVESGERATESSGTPQRVRNYRDLQLWRKAMLLARQVYEASAAFPAEERFGLTAQIRRSAVSVASNIAEGHGRGTDRDFAHFLHVARGSLAELDTQASLAQMLGLLAEADFPECFVENMACNPALRLRPGP